MIKKAIAAGLSLILLTGCNSLSFRNLGKTSVATGVAYVAAGTVPAIGVAAAALAYDEIIPDQSQLPEIKSSQQAVAYVMDKALLYALIGALCFFIITTIIAPIITRKRAYKQFKSDKDYNDKI
jgi:hypothetical protein